MSESARLTGGLHLEDTPELRVRFIGPGEVRYHPDGYGYVDMGPVTVFVDSRHIAADIAAAFADLAALMPGKPAGRIDERCSTCHRSAHFRGSADYHGHAYAPPVPPEDAPEPEPERVIRNDDDSPTPLTGTLLSTAGVLPEYVWVLWDHAEAPTREARDGLMGARR